MSSPVTAAPVWAPPLRSRLALLLLALSTRGDGLCHAYREYEDMDCLQPARHDGDHGLRDEKGNR